ncbi:MAG: endonuclease/exonuclease/phosphatase family protein [Ancrocorticia sp.]
MRLFWGLLALVISLVSLATVRPELFGVTAQYALLTPFAQIVALRGWLVLGFALTGILFLIVAGIRGLLFRRGRIALTFSLAMLLVAGLHAATMYSRGITASGTDQSSASGADASSVSTLEASADTSAAAENPDITVLQYNTLGGSVDISALADLITNENINVVSLPETSTQTGEDIVAHLAERGLWFQQFDTGTSGYEADYASTVLLVSSSLGEYVQTDIFEPSTESADSVETSETPGPTDPVETSEITAQEGSVPHAVRAVPLDGNGPTFVAVHPIAPGRDRMDVWQSEIRAAYGLCGTEPNAIVAGDFNSTADHEAALRLETPCTDAAAQAGAGALGTWPARLPELLSSPIDRVLTTTNEYRGSEAAIVNLGGSDHRGVMVRLTPNA